nr:hypothetical protein [uncultured Anaeromusa sp.]
MTIIEKVRDTFADCELGAIYCQRRFIFDHQRRVKNDQLQPIKN